MIVELVKGGRRVGITATSHKVISHLLGEVCKVAREAGVPLRAVQKANETDGCQDPMVTQVDPNRGNPEILNALTSGEAQVAAGTGWLWARSEMSSSVDVLFSTRRARCPWRTFSQFPKPPQVRCCLAIRNNSISLEGHSSAGCGGLPFDHLLQGRATITADQGLFLTETQRLHPDICSFMSELFYDGRLVPHPENQRQRLNTTARLTGPASGSFRSFTVDFFQKWAHGFTGPGCTLHTYSQ